MAKSNNKKKDFFWLSYSDLMTSLFFVMLVLFILVFAIQKNMISELDETNENLTAANEELKAAKEELDEIKRIQKALEKLDPNYFLYDKRNKRYKLKVDVQFNSNSAAITDIPISIRKEFLEAGKKIHALMSQLTKDNPNVNYLLIIEGNTQRSGDNYLRIPDDGYRLSYNRALALINYWQNNNLDFKEFHNCEILITGSGYFGKSREKNESENRKFTIQITPKIGDMKKLKK